MNQILKKQKLAENIYLMQVKAPDVAKNAKPGQFVMLQIGKKGERIPLSIADYDKNSVTVVFAAVGRTTKELAALKKGNSILHFTGPLGNPTEIMDFGKVCLIGGGFGIAPLYPIAKALKKAGNDVYIIAGARSKNLLFWEDNLKKACKELIITTDDGSKGMKGFVTDALERVMKLNKLDHVFAVGPPLMMKTVADMTKNRVRTVVSLNTIMLDGTGMCGSCRVRIAGEVKFACVDGPDFNAHAVDWDSIINRNKRYHEEEKHACRCGK
ncbi:sulfide/dihydroorotate dehydrogenase-like FAD/NAD-binding protein [Candidatus Woesearchaeota archaeon]|nr:sulfide/dihydroorotate dehydrogenase-like FAD/NAD-binding protein [Candidatus Woesearchaeota archaeon]